MCLAYLESSDLVDQESLVDRLDSDELRQSARSQAVLNPADSNQVFA